MIPANPQIVWNVIRILEFVDLCVFKFLNIVDFLFNTTSNANTAVGYKALVTQTNAQYNTAMGKNAGNQF